MANSTAVPGIEAARFELEREPQKQRNYVNVALPERWASTVGGAAVGLYALRRGGMSGVGLTILGAALVYRGVGGHCPAYAALGWSTARRPRAQPNEFFEHGIHVEEVVTIERPAAELFRFWRDFQNLPRFMRNVQIVRVLDERRSRWTAQAPAGANVQWDAEIINEEPDSLIAWRSLENADVDNAGSVRFIPAPGGRATRVKVVLEYIPPAGRLGAAVAWVFGTDAQHQIREDLSRFKQIVEAAEIPSVEGQPSSARGTDIFGKHTP